MNVLESIISKYVFSSRRVIQKCLPDFEAAVALCEAAARRGNKIIACGNGGSAAQAEHLVAELVGRYTRNRPPIPALTLGASHAVSSALGNDIGYVDSLTHEFAAVSNAGDVLIAFSTSGTSANILRLFSWATMHPAFECIAIVGGKETPLLGLAKVTIAVPVLETARIQEFHLAICHALAEELESRLQDEGRFKFFPL